MHIVLKSSLLSVGVNKYIRSSQNEMMLWIYLAGAYDHCALGHQNAV